MNQNENANNIQDNEYNALFEEFLKSENDRTFTKSEVQKILEANMYKEIFTDVPQDEKRATKNIIVTTRGIAARFFNLKFLSSFFISYLFYLGFLVLITFLFYNSTMENKLAVFIIAFLFTIIDKFIKPLVFIADLISFTFHKIGLITLGIYTVSFFILGNQLKLTQSISFSESILVATIILLLTFIVDYIKQDSFIKTNLLNDSVDEGSGTDEQD